MNDFRTYQGVDFSQEFLAHYGVGHDKGGNSGRYKWGSGDRPYQRTSMEGKIHDRREAKKAVKNLNRLDKRLAEARYQKARSSQAYDKASSKSSAKKMAAAEERMKRSDQEAKAIKGEIDSIVKDLTDSGYDLSQEVTKRAVSKGKTAALNALGIIGASTIGFGVFSTNRKMIGTKYRLKDEDREQLADKADFDGDSNAENMLRTLDRQDREAKYDKEYDDAVRNLSKGSASDKAWAEVMKVDRNRNSYKNEEDYDRDRRKAVDEYERVKNASENKNSSVKYGGLFSNPTGVYSPKKLSRKERREREERWQNEVQKTIDEMSKGSESDKAWAKYLSFDLDSVKNSYKRKEDYERDRDKALQDHVRIKQQENNARDKSKMPTSSGLTESQKKAFNRAKNEDKWDIDFLEVADPEYEWSDQKMLREYKEYLKDPEGWMQRR